MPRQLAVLVFTLIVIWLWRQDAKSRPQFSRALWIPFVWFVILGSRPLSWWVWFLFGIGGGSGSSLESNPVNTLFYTGLIVSSVVIVVRRGVSFETVVQRNVGLAVFLGYLALTSLWAEYPWPTARRWIKEIGAIPVLLVLLTERHPLEAVKVVFTRLAFILFTYSVLAIKYIPEIGRRYGSSGGLEVTGIAEQKNSLGEIVLVCGLVLAWQLLERQTSERRTPLRAPVLQWLITLCIGFWLLYQCDSKTAMLCLALGGGILLSTRIPFLADNPVRTVALCVIAPVLFFALDGLFNVSEEVLHWLGRDPTLTNRTEIWQAVQQNPVNPVLGCGFLNYWDIHRSIEVGAYEVGLKTAHNGYLEIYLDGGLLGLAFLAVMLLHTGAIHARAFLHRLPASGLALACFSALVIANVSESLFARRGPLWISFLLCCLFATNAAARSRAFDKPTEGVDGVLPGLVMSPPR